MFTYLQILGCLYLFINLYSNITVTPTMTINNLIIFLNSYSSTSKIFLLLILFLSGLPPFMFFLVKLVFLLKILANTTLIIQLMLFFNFFMNMLFYLQIFQTTNLFYYNSMMLKNLPTNFSIINNTYDHFSNMHFNF